MPFGEELPLVAQGSSNTKQFTGHERDAENRLDYMLPRYYSSSLGRFMAVDPLGGSTGNPQSWNRFSYVRNNPVAYTDPHGTSPHGGGNSGRIFVPNQGGKGGTWKKTKMEEHCWCNNFKSDKTDSAEAQKEVDSAYKQQEQVRSNVTQAQFMQYWVSYGRDLLEDLTPDHGFTLTIKDMNPGDHGEYSSLWNTGTIDRDALSNPELFEATLLHETGHFGQDMSGYWPFESAPQMSTEVQQVIQNMLEAYPINIVRRAWGEGDAGWAMEAARFGRIPTVEAP